MQQVLLAERLPDILAMPSGPAAMFAARRHSDLRLLYKLLSPIPEAHTMVAKLLQQHVTDVCAGHLAAAANDEKLSKEAALKLVQALLEVRHQCTQALQLAFCSGGIMDSLFQRCFSQAFETALNDGTSRAIESLA